MKPNDLSSNILQLLPFQVFKIHISNIYKQTNKKKTYSACKTVVSSNNTFLFNVHNLDVNLGRFSEVALGGGVDTIFKSGVFLPTEIFKFHKSFKQQCMVIQMEACLKRSCVHALKIKS